MANEDARNRTPDSELSAGELEDQPEEVAKNKIKDAFETYRCQFCGESSPQKDWVEDACPLCGRKYDYILAQDSEE